MNVSQSLPILIVGAGPVGMVTALALVRAGIPVIVFDALAQTPTAHRAATTHPSSMEILEPFGMTDRLLELGLKSELFQYRDRVTGEIICEFDYGVIKDETDYPFALQVEQHKTVGVALELLAGNPHFQLLREHEVTAVEQGSSDVTVTVRTPDGESRPFKGAYVIGCDGGKSTVRKSQNIDFPGFTWAERFMIVATLFDFAAEDGFRFRNYVAHTKQWCAVFKIPGPDGNGMWRTLVPVLSDESDDAVTKDDWIRARFDECLPYARDTEIVHRNLYKVHQRVAASFRNGRVMLAGDAAHVNNPLGGMGMNSGIQDAISLTEKLVRIYRGEADADPLLDLYDRQRRPLAQKYVQAQTIQNKETLGESDLDARQRRFDELKHTAEDLDRHRAYLRRVSLLDMWRESNTIT